MSPLSFLTQWAASSGCDQWPCSFPHWANLIMRFNGLSKWQAGESKAQHWTTRVSWFQSRGFPETSALIPSRDTFRWYRLTGTWWMVANTDEFLCPSEWMSTGREECLNVSPREENSDAKHHSHLTWMLATKKKMCSRQLELSHGLQIHT